MIFQSLMYLNLNMQFYIEAIGIGFLLSIMPGPIFFLLLETSITKGIRAAISFDVGVILSDLIYIFFASIFFGELKQFDLGDNKLLFRTISGVIFIAYGLYNYFKRVEIIGRENSATIEIQAKQHVLLLLKGFILNFANPFVVFYWLSVMTLGQAISDNTHEASASIFIIFVLGTFFSFDLIKIILAKALRSLVTDSFLKALNKLIGIVFTVIGVLLIVQYFVSQ